MRTLNNIIILSVVSFLFIHCSSKTEKNQLVAIDTTALKPLVVTQKVKHDSDDPAIWINPQDSTQVLIIGTDKGGDTGDGGLFAFNLSGNIVDSVRPLKRPNNVDIAYGLMVGGKLVDIAVCTERNAKSIRVFSLPDLEALDNGGIPVFEGELDSLRDPMGVALYTNPIDQKYMRLWEEKQDQKMGPTSGNIY